MQNLSNLPFLGRGFRPFFFFGALFALISMFIWGGFYAGHWNAPQFMNDPVMWHAHEMVYGFTMAIIAGFLLTAVANWTGGAPVRQLHLLALLALWCAGRITMNIETGLPLWAVNTLELSFIPALAGSLAIPLIKQWNKRNFIFLALLSGLWGFDLWFLITASPLPVYLAMFIIMIMISLIGGRIIPAFTVGALRQKGQDIRQTDQRKMDIAALASLLFLAVSFVSEIPEIIATAALISSTIHLLRMRFYHTKRTLKDPMLWILHIGYLWLVIGLALLGMAALDVLPYSTALHALTAGAIGSMTLGMMCRVAMGHTGRTIQANIPTTAAFIMMQLLAVLRVFTPLAWPEHTGILMALSAGLWALCFALYLTFYSAILFGPRPDGRPA